jgi:hypothetical protein
LLNVVCVYLCGTRIVDWGCRDIAAPAERRGLRYPSDLTEAEWALVKPIIPPAKRGGRAYHP